MNKIATYVIIAAVVIASFVLIYDQFIIPSSNKSNEQVDHPKTNTPTDTSTVTSSNPYLTLYSLPNETKPNSILADKDGFVWVTSSKLDGFYRIDPEKNTITKYQSSDVSLGHMSWTMLKDNDGFIWFAQFGDDSVVRFNPSDGSFISFQTNEFPFQMKYDPKNNGIWFTTLKGTIGLIQKIGNDTSVKSYKTSEFFLGNNTETSGLSISNGSIWVTELEGRIFEIKPITDSSGVITNITRTITLPPKNEPPFWLPTDVLLGKNDILWTTEHGPSTITRINLESNLSTRLPTAKSAFHVSTLPFWLRPSLDGKGIWFNEHEGGSVGFLTDNMSLVEYRVPIYSENEFPLMLNLAEDPNDHNKLWFSLWTLNEVGVVDKSIKIPFDIHLKNNRIEFSKEKKEETIHIDVVKDSNPFQQSNILYLNASSSIDSASALVNMTAAFTKDKIDLNNMTGTIGLDLSLKDESLQPGNYTVGVNVGNELVTRTAFVYVTVR